jgi:hypothetical protein
MVIIVELLSDLTLFDPTSSKGTNYSQTINYSVCWRPSASEGPQIHDLTMPLEYNVWTWIFEQEPTV